MKRIKIISDKNLKSQKIKNEIKSLMEKKEIVLNCIIVIGGDGFMLKTLKKHISSDKFFYGVNSGNYGFLMNKFDNKKFINNLNKSKLSSIYPLEMIVKKKNKKKNKYLAINEVSILRQSKQTATISIQRGSKMIIKKLISDGVLVSTPAGSTAYNFSVSGPILDIKSKKLAISPISPFRPRNWKYKIVGDNKEIIIRNLDPIKRPISAVADNQEVRNVTEIKLKMKKEIKINILFNKDQDLKKKMNLELVQREIS